MFRKDFPSVVPGARLFRHVALKTVESLFDSTSHLRSNDIEGEPPAMRSWCRFDGFALAQPGDPVRGSVTRGAGQLIEFGETVRIFDHPRDERTVAYISGKFG